MEKQDNLATEILCSIEKDKKFLTKALFVSLIASAVLAIVAFIKK